MSPTETKESTKREIAVEIPAAEVTRETEALIQKYQKLARLPGFRKGHVPASIIRQRFAEDIKTDVVEALVPRYFRREADKQGLIPVSQPRVSDLHIHDGEPLRFKASFEILPKFPLAFVEGPQHAGWNQAKSLWPLHRPGWQSNLGYPVSNIFLKES